ncbi:MAG TPA: hypothetical protein VD884_04830 [Ohtaekwangia sp.]|nr:hypothetical protein [Ohtaekwangia sp.]
MNTKLIMTLSAVTLGAAGISLTFLPEIVLGFLNIPRNNLPLFLIQILGAFYFAFGMLNWMTKANLIGGIYNRPVAVANLSHFLIAGLALVKGLFSNPDLPHAIWIIAAIIFCICRCVWDNVIPTSGA